MLKEKEENKIVEKEKLRLLQRRDNVAYEVRLIVTNALTPFAATKR